MYLDIQIETLEQLSNDSLFGTLQLQMQIPSSLHY